MDASSPPANPSSSICAGDEREEAAWICDRMQQIAACAAKSYGRHGCALPFQRAKPRAGGNRWCSAGIPYRIYGGLRFYDRKEVEDILAYLRVLVNPADDISVRRIINVPKRAIGDTTVNELGAPRRAGGHAAADRVPWICRRA